MFSGIVQGVTEVVASEMKNGSLLLTLARPPHCVVKLGESVAVNGICLTIAGISENACTFELMPETLQRTTFGAEIPKVVNIEQSLRMGDPLGGHVMTGHVDCVGAITAVTEEGDSRKFGISFPKEFAKLIVMKGSIAVDGISLTVAALDKESFAVILVSHTLRSTTLSQKKAGDRVNLEFDIIAKHLARMAEAL